MWKQRLKPAAPLPEWPVVVTLLRWFLGRHSGRRSFSLDEICQFTQHRDENRSEVICDLDLAGSILGVTPLATEKKAVTIGIDEAVD